MDPTTAIRVTLLPFESSNFTQLTLVDVIVTRSGVRQQHEMKARRCPAQADSNDESPWR